MRSLTTSLLAAQKSASRRPYLKLEIVEKVAGVARLSWSQLYSGSEADFYHAATMPGDGSLVRARVDPADGRLYRQRVVNPGPGSNFSSWIQMDSASTVSGIALSSQGSRVLLFYVLPDQRSIYLRESNDYGATFGAPFWVYSPPTTVGWLAADISGNGTVGLFYSVGGTVYVTEGVGESWSSPSAWPNSLAQVTGLACCYQGDWNLAVTGQATSGGYGVWTCLYGDGGSQSPDTWSSLRELTISSPNSAMEFRCPFLDLAEVYHLTFLEKYTGSGSYQRPFWAHSLPSSLFADNLWREPVPWNFTSSYGLAFTSSGGYAWLSRPAAVWRAPLSPSPLEVTSAVLALEGLTALGLGQVRVVLRNDDGRFLNPGSGDYAALKKGSEVLVSPGYHSAAGPEASSGLAYWIEGWEYLSRGGQALFVLHAGDGWGLLRRWRARRQFTWAAGEKSVAQLLSFLLARAGLKLSILSGSSTLTTHKPAFTVHPSESGAQVVERLLSLVPDVLFFRGSTGYVKNPTSGDVTDYSYGTDHPLLEGRYSSFAGDFNRAQVFGGGVLGEAFSWEELGLVYDRLRQVHDLNLDTLSKAQERAGAELGKVQRAALGGEVRVPVNCGQELYDVIAISDARAGLSQARRRVMGLALHYEAREKEPRYEQRLALGGV